MFSRAVQSALVKLAGVLTVSPFQSLFQPLLQYSSPSQNVNDFITRETPIAVAGLLANIGPHGSKSRGAHAGVVIASPNTHSPNYVYTWIRDSSLVYKVLIDEYVGGTDANLPGINEWIASQSRLQQVSNPSGSITTGGLGEPKFEIDETAFKDGWGRPQRDGPALRATSMITFANYLIAIGNKTYVQEKIWPIVQLDLDYTASFWNRTGFDLWEEVLGASFFTTAVQHRALREGATFAKAFGQNGLAETYEEQANNSLCFLQSYWNPSDSYITANALVVGPQRPTGLDANTVLGSIHTFDPEAGCDSATFQPCSDKALANLYAFVNSFRGDLYPINSGVPSNEAVALGRYASDIYSGDEHDPHANPWYLCTLSVAEQLYDALHVWTKLGSLEVTSLSLPFFQNIVPEAKTGTFDSDSTAFKNITTAVKHYADGFVGVVARFTPADGSLAEQFRRDNGKPQSALDLTWSYASALTAFAARGHWWEPESWGAKDSKVPSVCKPNVGPLVEVKFSVEAHTQWGENIFVVGNADALGNWDPNNAVALLPTNYPIWTGTVHVPGDTIFDYKYIRKVSQHSDWEPRGDRRVKAPAVGSGSLNDVWGN